MQISEHSNHHDFQAVLEFKEVWKVGKQGWKVSLVSHRVKELLLCSHGRLPSWDKLRYLCLECIGSEWIWDTYTEEFAGIRPWSR